MTRGKSRDKGDKLSAGSAEHLGELALSGPTATAKSSRATQFALHSVARTVPTFSALNKGCLALQAASWKVSRFRGVSQLHCACHKPEGNATSQQTVPKLGHMM